MSNNVVKIEIRGGIPKIIRKDKWIYLEIIDKDYGNDNEKLGEDIVIEEDIVIKDGTEIKE